MAGEYPTLNEVEPSWADVRISIPIYNGPTVKTPDIAGIKVSDKLDIGVVRGASGGKKRKRTTGQLDDEASITFYMSGWRAHRDALASVAPLNDAGQKQIGLVGFDIIYQYTPPGSVDIFTIKVAGCRVAGRSFEGAEGPDAAKVEIPLSIMGIEEIADGVGIVLI